MKVLRGEHSHLHGGRPSLGRDKNPFEGLSAVAERLHFLPWFAPSCGGAASKY